jgi:hypothetical protein
MINGIPVIVGIATYDGPGRRESLRETIDSLAGQVQMVYVYHNDYMATCDNDHAVPLPGELLEGDIGDIGKFWVTMMIRKPFYLLTCDDDLIYAPDYVETIVDGIERYGRRAAVSFHGRQYYGPVGSFYRDFPHHVQAGARNHRCLDKVEGYHECTMLGTGCLGWHSSLFDGFPLTMNDFMWKRKLAPNMADIHFSRKCNFAGIKRIALPHEADWIKHSPHVSTADTIAASSFNNDQIQTELFNSVEWKL